MTLRQHIFNEYGGNVSAFARDVGTSQTQASRWIAMDCVWLNGQVFKQLSKFGGRVIESAIVKREVVKND